MASTRLTRTPSVTGSQTTHTFSAWFKRSAIPSSGNNNFLTAYYGNLARYTTYYFENNTLGAFSGNYTTGGSSTTSFHKISNAVFRDTSAWYHIVIALDTTQATSTNRIKIYVNGEQITSFSTDTDPSLNDTNYFNVTTTTMEIGSYNNGSFYDGSMAHVHFIDGTAYDASAFGETDATTGIWKPKTAPSVTYGTNGFFLKFENSGAFGTDSSGNGNNFTVNGTMTQTIDTPSNVFATWNPLSRNADCTYSNGNLSLAYGTSSTRGSAISTLGVTQGKYYWEVKVSGGTNPSPIIGITNSTSDLNNVRISNDGITYFGTGTVRKDGSDVVTGLATLAVNDILGVAVDYDAQLIYFYKNGTLLNSGGTDFSSLGGGFYFAGVSDGGSADTISYATNFGNGYFGTVKVSTANSDTAGIGEFEYQVPDGYYSLCTKNINLLEYS